MLEILQICGVCILLLALVIVGVLYVQQEIQSSIDRKRRKADLERRVREFEMRHARERVDVTEYDIKEARRRVEKEKCLRSTGDEEV